MKPCEPGSQSNLQTTTNAGSSPSDGSDTRPNYLGMGIGEACYAKWKAGQQKYGPVFRSNPLVELDEELLDAINYVAEAERQGYDMGNLFSRFFDICAEVRGIIRKSGEIDTKT